MALPSYCNNSVCASQVQAKHRGICPIGWHIPSDAEWTTLIDDYVGWSTAGTKLKATSRWISSSGLPDTGTDDYGFSALPGGAGGSSGNFGNVGDAGAWWSTTEHDASYTWSRLMLSDIEVVNKSLHDKSTLISVRCIKDVP
jgi:uncharacterized protein (TIGR02145 family)